MDTDTQMIVFASIVGFIVGLIISYHIIRSAVKSATVDQEQFIRAIYRMKVKEMIDKGYQKEELTALKYDNEGEFWDKLQNKKAD
jgi:hypothetical protein